jgi:hypothetical protein
MVPVAHDLIAELDAEVPATRRVLERLPEDRFGWRPHPKSMTVAQLAQHVAMILANVARFTGLDGFEAPVNAPALELPSCHHSVAAASVQGAYLVKTKSRSLIA